MIKNENTLTHEQLQKKFIKKVRDDKKFIKSLIEKSHKALVQLRVQVHSAPGGNWLCCTNSLI